MWDLWDLYYKFKDKFVPKYEAVTYLSLDDDLNFYVGDDEVDSIVLSVVDDVTVQALVKDEDNDVLEGVPVSFYDENDNLLGTEVTNQYGVASFTPEVDSLDEYFESNTYHVERLPTTTITAKFSTIKSNECTVYLSLTEHLNYLLTNEYSEHETGVNTILDSNNWDCLRGSSDYLIVDSTDKYIDCRSEMDQVFAMNTEFTSDDEYILSFDYKVTHSDRNSWGFGNSYPPISSHAHYVVAEDIDNTIIERHSTSQGEQLASFESNIYSDTSITHNFKLYRKDNTAIVLLNNKYIIYTFDMTDQDNKIGLFNWGWHWGERPGYNYRYKYERLSNIKLYIKQ